MWQSHPSSSFHASIGSSSAIVAPQHPQFRQCSRKQCCKCWWKCATTTFGLSSQGPALSSLAYLLNDKHTRMHPLRDMATLNHNCNNNNHSNVARLQSYKVAGFPKVERSAKITREHKALYRVAGLQRWRLQKLPNALSIQCLFCNFCDFCDAFKSLQFLQLLQFAQLLQLLQLPIQRKAAEFCQTNIINMQKFQCKLRQCCSCCQVCKVASICSR